MGEWINKMIQRQIDMHTAKVVEDSDGCLAIEFPQSVIDKLQWKEGDDILWSQEGDRWILRKKVE